MKRLENAISVIIPTLAEARRAESLLRAIGTVRAQEDISAVPIVVVNGQRFDSSLVQRLQQMNSIQLHLEPRGGLVNALVVGRRLVETPYFSFLDDDDEYLPHALRTRLDAMLADDRVDAVVSNGFRLEGPVRTASAANIADARKDPFVALLDNNWLTSCGGLYRTKRINARFFADATTYAEWTYLGFKLSLSHRIEFVDRPSYVIHDTEGSLSKTVNYNAALAGIMEKILGLPLPAHAHRAVQRKYGSALHDQSSHFLEVGERKKALQCHLKSLRQPGGLRFLLYSRKFIGL